MIMTTKMMTYQAEDGVLVPYLQRYTLYFSVLIEFQFIYAALCVMNSFSPYNPFPRDGTLQDSHYSTLISMEKDEQYSFVPPVLTLSTIDLPRSIH